MVGDNSAATGIVVGTDSAQVTSTTPVPAAKKMSVARSAPKWETDTRDRLKAAIKKFSKPLADLVSRDANEGDTRLLVTDFLCDGLGFDKFADLTTEYQVKGEFADYGVRIDKQMIAFIEVKRIATKLDARHLRQVEMYAVNEGVEWVILTNAQNWKVYHISGGLPVSIDLTIDVNLLSDESIPVKANQLFYLTRESLKRHQIDELWEAKRATSPRAFAKVILAPAVLNAIQKELRRQTGYNAPDDEVKHLITTTILKEECFDKNSGKG